MLLPDGECSPCPQELILTIFQRGDLAPSSISKRRNLNFTSECCRLQNYSKLCIRSFLQTGTNLGNRAVSHDKSLHACGWVLIMTGLWQFKWQYISSKAYGFIIYHLHMIYMHPYTCIFPSHRKKVTNCMDFKKYLCMLITEDGNLSGTTKQHVYHLQKLQHFIST